MTVYLYFFPPLVWSRDTVAEWLRRMTRNHLGFSRVGSSPASVVTFFVRLSKHNIMATDDSKLFLQAIAFRYLSEGT